MFHFTRFPRTYLYIQYAVCWVYQHGFPHSEILGSKVAYHLPEAYRRLPRPSSASPCQAILRTPLRASAIQNHDCKIVMDGCLMPGVMYDYLLTVFFETSRPRDVGNNCVWLLITFDPRSNRVRHNALYVLISDLPLSKFRTARREAISWLTPVEGRGQSAENLVKTEGAEKRNALGPGWPSAHSWVLWSLSLFCSC